jgi:succinyl-CoA synthetase beta subunit
MSRKRLSEFRAKTILYAALGQAYEGIEIDITNEQWGDALPQNSNRYVVKVDQAVKGRFRKGLVKLNRTSVQTRSDIKKMASQGYQYFLIEPYREHDVTAERYLSLESTRAGTNITSSHQGGVDVENHADKLLTTLYKPKSSLKNIDVAAAKIDVLVSVFSENHFSFLEINPLLTTTEGLILLDAAVEVDDEAEFFVENWSSADFRRLTSRKLTTEEEAVIELGARSQASFTLEVMNPEGSIFLLLSGGGASVIVADEVCNEGYGEQLANYGEYSGNPSTEETELYTSQVLSLLTASSAPRKVLIIAGGVANFTDIRATFKGVLMALRKYEQELRHQKVAIYVRRGGPHEVEGLSMIRQYLEEAKIVGSAAGPELPLTDVVSLAIRYVEETES